MSWQLDNAGEFPTRRVSSGGTSWYEERESPRAGVTQGAGALLTRTPSNPIEWRDREGGDNFDRMCGRFSLTSSADEIREEFGVDVDASELPPRYNIAPQTPIAVIGRARDGVVRFGVMRWGLVPWWAKDAAMGNRLINARAESVRTRPMFRDAFELRRCLILADGFYEWRRDGKRKVPMRVRLPDGRPFAFAGIWERWRDPDGAMIYSCAIVTTTPSDQLRAIHDRMPVILDPGDREVWLDPDGSPERLLALLRPPDGVLDVYEVSSFVNAAANDGPECIEPVSPATRSADS